MNSRPKKYLKLEGSNITAGVVESVEQFLLHSRNPAFLQSCLQLLQASTIQDAKERLSLHTWALVHRCHGLDIPEDIVHRLANLSLLSPGEVDSLRYLRDNEVQSASQRPGNCAVNSSEVRILPGSQLCRPSNDDAPALQLTPPLYHTPESQDVPCVVASSARHHSVANRHHVLGGTMLETSPSGEFDDNGDDSNSQLNNFPMLDLRENNSEETSLSIEDCTGDQEEVSMLTPPGSLGARNIACSTVVANSLAEERHNNNDIQADIRDQAVNVEGDGTDIEEFFANSVLLLDPEDVEMGLPHVIGSIATRTCIQMTGETDADGFTGNKTNDESIEVSSMYEACSSQDTTDEQFAELNERNGDPCNSDSKNDDEIKQDRHQLVCSSVSGAIPKRRNNTRIVHLVSDEIALSKLCKTASPAYVQQYNFHNQSKRSKLSSSNYPPLSGYEQCTITQQHGKETSSVANPECPGQNKKCNIENTNVDFSCLLSQIDVATSALIAGLDREANNMIDDAMRSLSQTIASRDRSQGPHSSLVRCQFDKFLDNQPNHNSCRATSQARGTNNYVVDTKDVTTSTIQNEAEFTKEVPQERMQRDLLEPCRTDGTNKSLTELAKESKNNANDSKSIVDTDDTGSDYSLSDVNTDVSLGTMSDWDDDDTTDVAVGNKCREEGGGSLDQHVALDGSAGTDEEERSLTSFGSEPVCQDDTFSSLEHLSCACPPDDLVGIKSSTFTPEYRAREQELCDQSTLGCHSSSEVVNDDGALECNSSSLVQKPDDPSTLLKPTFSQGAEEDARRWTDDDASSIQSESLLKDYYYNA